jgi:hypothetical protein
MNATTEPRRIVLRCQCGHCDLPFGYVQDGVLIIQSRHNGEPHINTLRIEQLQTMQPHQECAIVATNNPT